MCSCQKQTSHHLSPMLLHFLGKEGIRAAGGDDVIKDEYLLTLEESPVKVHDAHLGNLLLSSSSAFMNRQAVLHQDKMGITILNTAQSAHLLAELLVAASVHFLTTSRHTKENHVLHLLAILFLQIGIHHLRHLLVGFIPSVLESIDKLSCFLGILTHIADSCRKYFKKKPCFLLNWAFMPSSITLAIKIPFKKLSVQMVRSPNLHFPFIPHIVTLTLVHPSDVLGLLLRNGFAVQLHQLLILASLLVPM